MIGINKLLAAAGGDLDAMKELANRLDGRTTQAVELDMQDTTATRMMAAEERLRKMRNGVSPAKVIDEEEDPEWLQ